MRSSNELDHKYLNELEYFKNINPSSEQIARFLYDRISEKARQAKVSLSRVPSGNRKMRASPTAYD